MARDFSIIVTNVAEPTDEEAQELQEVFETLANLPNTRAAVTDFDNPQEARAYVRRATAWADSQGYKFARKGDIKGEPNRVTFRVYKPKPSAEAAS